MNLIGSGEGLIAIVIDEDEKLIGCVTDGDVRRAILAGKSLDSSVRDVMNTAPKYLSAMDADQAPDLMRTHALKQVPLVDSERRVVGLRTWKEILGIKREPKSTPVLLMAGGKGTRLAPLTKIIPKPLVPLGEKTIIEVVMDRFVNQGYHNFVISLNYKAEMIRSYFDEASKYNVRFITESEYLGTAGCLIFTKDILTETFILTNCDVLAEIDYEQLVETHKNAGAAITMVGVMKNWKLPYGVISLKEGNFCEVQEKPQLDFLVNGGIYVIEPDLINILKNAEPLSMPDLIRRAKDEGMTVAVFPISTEWHDIGEIEEYRKVFSKFNFLTE